MSSTRGTISVVIASKGRPEVLDDTIESILKQTLLPEKIVIVVPTEADLPRKPWGDRVRHIVGPLGSSLQRNVGIEAIPLSIDYVAFFDDDFELKADYMEQVVAFLDASAGVVGFSGLDLAAPQAVAFRDPNKGIFGSPGESITREQSLRMVQEFVPYQQSDGLFLSLRKGIILYGCNMVIRRGILAYENFDANLPLYSYAEDYDLTMRLINYGHVGLFRGAVGVHLQTKGGRVREVQRGYSQVANNWYFLKKGTVHLPPRQAWIRFWLAIVLKNILKNSLAWLKGDRSADYLGRVKGHLIAVKDIFTGRSDPNRVKEL